MMIKLPLLTVCLVLTTVFPASSQERVVNIYNWSDYIEDKILSDFTTETGIKVVYDVYDSNEILETKLLAGGTGYDVVAPSAEFLGRQIPVGLFQKLNKSKLSHLSNMWDFIQKRTATYDPDNAYSINYMWGTIGIGYNKAKLKKIINTDKIDSWNVLFDPKIAAKFKECGIYFLDAASDMLRVAFHYLGLDPNSPSIESFAQVEALYLKIRPHIRKFHSSEYIHALANGDICMAIGYSGDIFQARSRAKAAGQGIEIGYSIPKEGTQMWFDQLAIPMDAKHVEEAYEFLNYIMRPDVITQISNHIFYANGNKASQPLLDKAISNDPEIYPDEIMLKKLFVPLSYDMKTQRIATRIWTKIVTGQ